MPKTAKAQNQIHNLQQIDYFEKRDLPRMVPTGSPSNRRQVDEVIRLANLTPKDQILEVGCGLGRYTLLLAERGLAVSGLDISQILLDRLDSFNNGRFSIPLTCADILDSPPELENKFDVVIGFFTLHHLHDIVGSLAAMHRLLKPKGRLLFLEPNAFNPLFYLQVFFTPGMTWQGDGGIIKMRPNVILPAMEQVGLVNPKIDRFGFFPPFISNSSFGATSEKLLEKFPLWARFLPYQLFYGERK